MFRLSQRADYGLMLLSSLARSKKLIPISAIAQKNQISPKFLPQVANELKRAGILTSKEGIAGGYSLAKSAGEIKLLDVLKVLEGELIEGKCFEEGHECTCGAGEMWQQMKKQMEATLGKKTVADLVGAKGVDGE